jgi:hypothetical protein
MTDGPPETGNRTAKSRHPLHPEGPQLRARMHALGMSDPSQTDEPALRELYAFWLERRNAQGRFHYADFDVTELPPHLLPQLYLIKVEPEARRFQVRIAGEQVVRLSGTNATGLYVDEMPGNERAQERMEFCLDHDLPYVATDALTWGAFDYKSFSICVLPLHDDADRITYLLALFCVHGLCEPITRNVHAALRSSNLPKVDSEVHDAAFAYWLSKRPGRGIPLRRDIDPLEIPQLLKHLVILDVLREPLDFRYRLIGDYVQAHFRAGLKGQSFREVEGKGPGSTLWDGVRKVVETGIPRYGRASYAGPEPDIDTVNDLLLPLSEDGRTVSQILMVAEFLRRAAA